MKKNIISRSMARMIGLMAFIATGGGLLVSTALTADSYYRTEIVVIFSCFFAISLVDHYRKLKEGDKRDEDN
ncbi:MAG: hypothetical protein Q4G61_04850 [Tissierellia bacterium]|nr:hypothetical protein [Tissierellia bacterium]